MESKIVRCECGKKLGVHANHWFMMENLFLSSFKGLCPQCESVLMWENEKLIIVGKEKEENGR
jgi:hypothetical protein